EIADAMRSVARDFIADGEMVAMEGNEILPFSDLQRRLGRREGDLFLGQEVPVQFVAFDLLWLDGRSLLDEPLRARRSLLEGLDGIKVSRITQAHSMEEIDCAFQ